MPKLLIPPEILSWVLPMLLSIPIGIITNIITPRAQNWLATRSLSRALKRVDVLKSELEAINDLHGNIRALCIKSARVVLSVLFFISLGLSLSSLGNLAYFIDYVEVPEDAKLTSFDLITLLVIGVSIIPYLIATLAALNYVRLIARVENIERYKKETTTQIEYVKGRMPKQATTK